MKENTEYQYLQFGEKNLVIETYDEFATQKSKIVKQLKGHYFKDNKASLKQFYASQFPYDNHNAIYINGKYWDDEMYKDVKEHYNSTTNINQSMLYKMRLEEYKETHTPLPIVPYVETPLEQLVYEWLNTGILNIELANIIVSNKEDTIETLLINNNLDKIVSIYCPSLEQLNKVKELPTHMYKDIYMQVI